MSKKYRVYYRTTMAGKVAIAPPHSIVVRGWDKESAQREAVRTLTLRGENCILTGYVTLVGSKPPKPF